MTIFRVNPKDKPKVLSAIKKIDASLDTLGKHYEKYCDWSEKVEPLEKKREAFKKEATALLAQTRKSYTEIDKEYKRLSKDKSASKEDISLALMLRKMAYNMGVDLKDFTKS